MVIDIHPEVINILLDNAVWDEFADLPLWHHSVAEIKASILPLHGAVHVQWVAQPIVWGASTNNKKYGINVFRITDNLRYMAHEHIVT